MKSIRQNPVRRVLRAINFFTLVSLNAPTSFRPPYADPTSIVGQGHRVF